MKQSLLADFSKDLPLLQNLEAEVLKQLKALLLASELKIHSLSARIKEPQSLAYKLRRPDRTYHQLSEITDLVGVRIITYFEDSVESLAALVEQLFEIDYTHSIDKRKNADVSHFGYRSLHYICRLKDAELEQARAYAFELQIRTILQHTWAEIEHDLGYKTTASVPHDIRRRFSRVASVLEMADAEFIAIRDSLENYKHKVQQKLALADTALNLDPFSLQEFLADPEVTALEQDFALRIGVPFSEDYFYPDYLIRMLEAVEMTELAHLRQTLLNHKDELLLFIQPYFEFTHKVWQFDRQSVGVFLRGYSLVFLAHFLLLRSSSLGIERLEKLTRFYQKIDYPHDELQARAVAQQLIETIQLS
jgi:putative GTP pyrophosphokinase